jgi:hypothetical protein
MKSVALVLVGLAVGVVAGVAVIPRAVAEPQAPPPRKWQQMCEPASSVPEASSLAGARGAEGWELVNYTPGAVCFKRPAQPKQGEPAWPGY